MYSKVNKKNRLTWCMCCATLGFAMRDLAQHIGLRPTSHTPGTLYAIAKSIFMKIGYLYRKPKFPVLCNFNGHVVSINGIDDTFKKITNIKLIENSQYEVIDSSGEGWNLFYSNSSLIYSTFTLKNRWTKKEIIELVNMRENNISKKMYEISNLDSKKLITIIKELILFLKEN